jgi:hypothetical protein
MTAAAKMRMNTLPRQVHLHWTVRAQPATGMSAPARRKTGIRSSGASTLIWRSPS